MEQKPKSFYLKLAVGVVGLLFFFNLLFLDLTIFKNQKEGLKITLPQVSLPQEQNKVCPATCVSQIYEATRSSKLLSVPTPTILPQAIAESTPANTPIPTQSQSSFVKEFFVPFGFGSSTADDWKDVGGLKATIDSTNYGDIKTVTFEASIRIPTGNEAAYVRLYNVTDKHPVWYSDLLLEGGTPSLLVSKPITLDSGNKTYQVQMKTSLKYEAFLDQARLHIVTF